MRYLSKKIPSCTTKRSRDRSTFLFMFSRESEISWIEGNGNGNRSWVKVISYFSRTCWSCLEIGKARRRKINVHLNKFMRSGREDLVGHILHPFLFLEIRVRTSVRCMWSMFDAAWTKLRNLPPACAMLPGSSQVYRLHVIYISFDSINIQSGKSIVQICKGRQAAFIMEGNEWWMN